MPVKKTTRRTTTRKPAPVKKPAPKPPFAPVEDKVEIKLLYKVWDEKGVTHPSGSILQVSKWVANKWLHDGKAVLR